MAGVTSNVSKVVTRLKVVTGEIEERVEAELRRGVNEILAKVMATWPTKSTRSIRAWRLEEPGRLHVRIANPVEYVSWVHRKGQPPDESRIAIPLLTREGQRLEKELSDKFKDLFSDL